MVRKSMLERIKDLMPESVEYYNDGKVEKFRIKHKPNPFVPVFAEGYDDYEKGISMYKSSNKVEDIANQESKRYKTRRIKHG